MNNNIYCINSSFLWSLFHRFYSNATYGLGIFYIHNKFVCRFFHLSFEYYLESYKVAMKVQKLPLILVVWAWGELILLLCMRNALRQMKLHAKSNIWFYIENISIHIFITDVYAFRLHISRCIFLWHCKIISNIGSLKNK